MTFVACKVALGAILSKHPRPSRSRVADEDTQAIVIYTEPGGPMEAELATGARRLSPRSLKHHAADPLPSSRTRRSYIR
jgi:hypothetical protein